MKPRMILCGGKGQLGRECEGVFSSGFDVFSFGSGALDITDKDSLRRVFPEIRPEVVVNCAAFTKVDLCETERERAWAVNAEGPANLAAACSDMGSLLVHISTDYVFNGKRDVPEPYVESDSPDPISFYGRTKLAGEDAVRNGCRDYMIIRTAWLFGETGGNFLKTMLRLAITRPGSPLRVVDDQYGSPTWAYRLALQMERLIRKGGRGLYHATAEGWCTWCGLADYFLSSMGVSHIMEPIKTHQYPTPARRPANSILENRRLKEEGCNIMVDWRRDVDEFVNLSGERILQEIRSYK
jgi:dTDP-4-dehydrorhamnose reductase